MFPECVYQKPLRIVTIILLKFKVFRFDVLVKRNIIILLLIIFSEERVCRSDLLHHFFT